MIISGGTGSGKTTLLNAMSRLIGHGERVVTVEDAAELQLQQPHVVRLETRPASLEGRGEITQRDLVRNALRMRPDRIIIGEVRGGEAFDMLQAMNTGHDGSMSTIHANNTRDALIRVENMVQMGNMGLPSKAIRTQIVGAVDMIVQVERQRDGSRRLTQVTEVCGMEGDVITMNDDLRVRGGGREPRREAVRPLQGQPCPAVVPAAAGLFRPGKGLAGGHVGCAVMTSVNFWLLGILSCCMLMGLGYAGLLVNREQTRQEKLAQRISNVLTPHMRTHRIELSAFIQTPNVESRSVTGRLASVFGFDPASLERYPLQWWMVLIIAAVAAKIAQALASDMIGQYSLLVLPIAWVVLSRTLFSFFEKRYQDKLLHQLPDALAMVVRAVRVGIPVLRAINNVSHDGPAPTRDLFSVLVNQISVGVALDDAVMAMARRSKMAEYRFFATAISLQMQTGGALSETLENLADVVRKRVALKARAMALASEARTSAMVLAALPFVSGTALWVLNPDYIGKLFQPGLGQEIFSAAVLSLGLGLLVMRSLIRASLA